MESTNKHTLWFGESCLDLSNPSDERYIKTGRMDINDDQLRLLESLADVQIDSEGNKWFIINRLKLQLKPNI